jgi:hypothetical protein
MSQKLPQLSDLKRKAQETMDQYHLLWRRL